MKKLTHTLTLAVAALTLSIPGPSHSGILAGAVGGVIGGTIASSASASAGSKTGSGVLVTSDDPKRDTISCVSVLNKHACYYYFTDRRSREDFCSPAEFARLAGYKVLHKSSVVLMESRAYIVMEVSR
jgi:hypothetical protein